MRILLGSSKEVCTEVAPRREGPTELESCAEKSDICHLRCGTEHHSPPREACRTFSSLPAWHIKSVFPCRWRDGLKNFLPSERSCSMRALLRRLRLGSHVCPVHGAHELRAYLVLPWGHPTSSRRPSSRRNHFFVRAAQTLAALPRPIVFGQRFSSRLKRKQARKTKQSTARQRQMHSSHACRICCHACLSCRKSVSSKNAICGSFPSSDGFGPLLCKQQEGQSLAT